MKFVRIAILVLLASHCAFGFVATTNQNAVNLRFELSDKRKLVVDGVTYKMLVNCTDAMIEKFTVGDEELIGAHPLCPILGGGKVNGPTQVEIRQCGPVFAEIHLTGIWWTDLHANIEVVLYCFAERVYAAVNVQELDTPRDLAVGWYGAAKFSMPLGVFDAKTQESIGFNGLNPKALVTVPSAYIQAGIDVADVKSKKKRLKSRAYYKPLENLSFSIGYPADQPGRRTSWIILLGEPSHDALVDAYRAEHARGTVAAAAGIALASFVPEKAVTEFVATQEEIPIDVSVDPSTLIDPNTPVDPAQLAWKTPRDFVLCVRGPKPPLTLYGENGAPLALPVQYVREANGGWSSYFKVSAAPGNVFTGTVRSVGHGVALTAQGASYRSVCGDAPSFSFDFHERLSPIATGFVVSPDGSHAGVSAFRICTSTGTLPSLLQSAETYLTGPLLTNLGAKYRSPDGKWETTIEVFEPAQIDAKRAFIKLVGTALETAPLDLPSAHALRMFEMFVAIPQKAWSNLTYTDQAGSIATQAFPDAQWVLDGVPLSPQSPYIHARDPEGNGVGCLVSRVDGSLGGQAIKQLGVSATTENGVQHVFLTVPGITSITKGDRIEVHALVMPTGAGDIPDILEIQRTLYGQGLAKMTPQRGSNAPGYPRRIKLDASGLAEFDITGGSPGTPIIVEGVPDSAVPLLWEKKADQWSALTTSFDSYQLYRAADGTFSAVFLLDLATDQTRHFSATFGAGIESIASDVDGVLLSGKAIELTSPSAIDKLVGEPVDGGPFVRGRVSGGLRVH